MKAGRTVKKSLLEARERGTCVMYWLSSLVTWKLEMVSNKVVNLAKDISSRMLKVWLPMIRHLKSEMN